VSLPLSELLESLSGSKLESKESKVVDIGDKVDAVVAGEMGVGRRRIVFSCDESRLDLSKTESVEDQLLKSKNDMQSKPPWGMVPSPSGMFCGESG
jgi:hypothetical protein